MIATHQFRHPEFREKVTNSILEMLADLPDAHRNIFVWNHYRGYQVERIAEILGCSPAEVDTTLGGINSILHGKIRRLLAEDPRLGSEIDLRTPEEGVPDAYDAVAPLACP